MKTTPRLRPSPALRGLAVLLAGIAVIAGALLLAARHPNPHPAAALDAARLAAAVRSYADTLRTQGKPVPTSVSLEQLVARGLLAPNDVRLFAGLEVTLNPAADESHPQERLAQVRFPDGAIVEALADGSVQQRPR